MVLLLQLDGAGPTHNGLKTKLQPRPNTGLDSSCCGCQACLNVPALASDRSRPIRDARSGMPATREAHGCSAGDDCARNKARTPREGSPARQRFGGSAEFAPVAAMNDPAKRRTTAYARCAPEAGRHFRDPPPWWNAADRRSSHPPHGYRPPELRDFFRYVHVVGNG